MAITCRGYELLGDAPHHEVIDFFPGYDYKNPVGDRAVVCDMRHPKNMVGQQQRAFSTYWALQMCGPLDLGLDLGSPKGLTPYCIHVDINGGGGIHPFYGGDAYVSDVVLDAGKLSPIFPDGQFPYITSNHSLEHMGQKGCGDGPIVEIVVGWMRALRPEGIMTLVVPDNDEFDVMGSDKDHKNAWGHSDFERRILDPLIAQTGASVLEWNTFDNHFSFNVVLRRAK